MFFMTVLFGIGAFVLISFILKMLFESESRDLKQDTREVRPEYISDADRKGIEGESDIFGLLTSVGEYRVLRNTYITVNGKTSEIDLIAVNGSGIHIFESKNYSGWIFGSENDKMWTQVLRKDKKYSFYNPIRQNQSHISAIDSFFKKKYRDRIFSYIVFGQNAELKKLSYDPEKNLVGTIEKFHNIYSKMNTLPKVLSDGEVEYIYRTLEEMSGENVSDSIKAEHLAYVESLKENRY